MSKRVASQEGAGADWAKAVGVALAGWALPGLGHWLLGRRGKALFFLVTIWGTFLTGWVLSEYRAVFWKKDRIATYGQLGMGLPTAPLLLVGEPLTDRLGLRDFTEPMYEPTGHSENLLPHYDVGALYTCVAGLLNVVVALSAASLALGGGPGDRENEGGAADA